MEDKDTVAEISKDDQVITPKENTISPKKTKRNYWKFLVVVLYFTSILGGLLAYQFYLQVQELKASKLVAQKMIEKSFKKTLSESFDRVYNPSPTPRVVPFSLLSNSLNAFCKENKINLNVFPVNISESVKSKYKIGDSIDCDLEPHYLANISLQEEKKEYLISKSKTIYFYSQDTYDGKPEQNFPPLSKMDIFNFAGQNVSFQVSEPGPYGINSDGVWVNIENEKKDETSGTIVRVSYFEISQDPEIIDIVKKHGVKVDNPQDEPEFRVTRTTDFKKEFLEFATTYPRYLEYAKKVNEDLEGITF